MKTHKICKKGVGKAYGFKGCEKELPVSKFDRPNFIYGLGLSCGCYNKWLLNTEAGKEKLQSGIIQGKKQAEKKSKKEFRQIKRNSNEKNAMAMADMYFSRYIRLSGVDENGNCTCYTCGSIHPIKEIDNGHYQKRAHKATRFHENNTKPQCKICNGNTLHNGKQVDFRINLINEIGEKEVLEIERLAKTELKTSAKDYRDISDYYRKKVNELQIKLGVKYW